MVKSLLSERLLKWKNQIEDDKKEISQMEGGIKELMSRLKKEFGYGSLKEAKKGVDLLSEKIGKKKIWIERELLEIENSYGDLR